ncbi:MAG: methionyl-tRNA formyltransferase [Flavobacteriales bacterium]
MKDLRIVFFGTPDFAVASLRALVDNKFHVVAAVTAPDKPSGRGHKMQSPPVKTYAGEQGIPVMQPSNLKSEDFVNELRSCNADLQIVVAFRMLPEIVWNMPPLGTYNVHASLLPDYRGAAPINWAIINGENETGVTTFKLRHEIDTGNILLQQRVSIADSDNAGSLHDKLMAAGAALLVQSVEQLGLGDVKLIAQTNSKVEKHAPKIFKDDCRINWNQPAKAVRNFIRGMAPFPAAFSEISFQNGTSEAWKFFASDLNNTPSERPGVIRIEGGGILISCADQWLEIKEVQVPGKKRMTTYDFLKGLREIPKEVKN